ncbi:hypothetical protein DFP72DRAFT_1070627 [Ephemerocybe angulata]|uniref:Uncharacterized protein n=1 Tax=Ephemerocybe angulata TaxID=980116 RepID=A0A8H6M4X4_9AGAR|nr:hypothetical protein DFP72DRAFT_1070627 [Tulosesus angulatus]
MRDIQERWLGNSTLLRCSPSPSHHLNVFMELSGSASSSSSTTSGEIVSSMKRRPYWLSGAILDPPRIISLRKICGTSGGQEIRARRKRVQRTFSSPSWSYGMLCEYR